MLTGRRVLITGVVTSESIAWAVAQRAQLQGAEVILTTFDRARSATVEAAAQLPKECEIHTLDAASAEDFERLAQVLADKPLDAALHAVAFAPRTALAGDFLAVDDDAVEVAMRTSTTSFARLAQLLNTCAGPRGGSLVGLDFDAGGRAWPVYNWMGVCKAALQATMRYVARDLGPSGIRANLVAAGPLKTRAASGIPDFQTLLRAYEGVPLGWDASDPGPVADAVCFLLSDYARAITGEILHVDGGFNAMAVPTGTAMGSGAASDLGAG